MNQFLFSKCVYTIRDSKALADAIAAGGDGEFTEGAKWVTGHRFLEEARLIGQRVPLLFAPAESVVGVTHWALIEEIALTPNNTTIRFSSLQKLQGKHRLSSLVKFSDQKPLSDNFIRPYVPCLTPQFLLSVSSLTVPDASVPEKGTEGDSVNDEVKSTQQHAASDHRPRWSNDQRLDDHEAATDDELIEFVPTIGDERERILREIRIRQGQPGFRHKLIDVFNSQCAISGCTVLDVLEAAHIRPYRGPNDNHSSNGLLLRSDLHTLFDLNRLGIEPDTRIVHIHPSARHTPYDILHGSKLLSTHKLSTDALTLRWQEFLAASHVD